MVFDSGTGLLRGYGWGCHSARAMQQLPPSAGAAVTLLPPPVLRRRDSRAWGGEIRGLCSHLFLFFRLACVVQQAHALVEAAPT